MSNFDASLLEVEKERREKLYGTNAKARQGLMALTALILLWVLGIGVEGSAIRTLLFSGVGISLLAGAGSFALTHLPQYLPELPERYRQKPRAEQEQPRNDGRQSMAPRDTYASRRSMQHGDIRPSSSFGGNSALQSHGGNGYRSYEPMERSAALPRANINNANDLTKMLHNESYQGDAVNTTTSNFGANNFSGYSAPSQGLRIMYQNGPATADREATTETEMTALGINDLQTAMLKVREWMAKHILEVVQDIKAIDKFWSNKGFPAVQCVHSLQGTYQVQSTGSSSSGGGFGSGSSGGGFGGGSKGFGSGSSGGGFGSKNGGGFGSSSGSSGGGFGSGSSGGFGSKSSGGGFGSSSGSSSGSSGNSGQITLHQCLINEKLKVQQQRTNIDTFDLTSWIDRRISIESLLDVTLMFPTAGGKPTSPELTRKQQYVIGRLQALSQSRTLSAYVHDGGERNSFTDSMPCDAYLIVHVLTQKLQCLQRHIRLPHHQGNQRKDLSIICGNNGEPFFFVRYRNGSIDKTFHTKPGRDSLFQAFVIFAALIHKYHHGAYGDSFGDGIILDQIGLDKVVSEY